MTENEYKKLLIDMAEISEYEKKDEVIALLKLCKVTFEKTGIFARCGVWNQCKEYIYLSIIPDKLVQIKTHQKFIKDLCYEIYTPNDEYMLDDIFFKPGSMTDYEDISTGSFV